MGIVYSLIKKNGDVVEFKNMACFSDINTMSRENRQSYKYIHYKPKTKLPSSIALKYYILLNQIPFFAKFNILHTELYRNGAVLDLEQYNYETMLVYLSAIRYLEEWTSVVESFIYFTDKGIPLIYAFPIAHVITKDMIHNYTNWPGHSIFNSYICKESFKYNDAFMEYFNLAPFISTDTRYTSIQTKTQGPYNKKLFKELYSGTVKEITFNYIKEEYEKCISSR